MAYVVSNSKLDKQIKTECVPFWGMSPNGKSTTTSLKKYASIYYKNKNGIREAVYLL